MEMASEDPDISKIPLVGVIKEVAPTTQAETDETLGVGEFHEKYFGLQYPLYLDEEKNFYEYLGNRKLSIPVSAILKPWKAFRYYKSMTARMKEKKYRGEYGRGRFGSRWTSCHRPGYRFRCALPLRRGHRQRSANG
uniref:Uncharacterized protein n=1 Tax=Octactis speculum TaxID=3111310 RepID=A0A7S2DAY4_9STRA|mmetsp:Transcript_46303/g.63000  ORF Transcript_46303/g.63000 Transcript_46303/m.63000 type:complete len:137 (+) Transcript_46303:221-631(+)